MSKAAVAFLAKQLAAENTHTGKLSTATQLHVLLLSWSAVGQVHATSKLLTQRKLAVVCLCIVPCKDCMSCLTAVSFAACQLLRCCA